MLGSAARQTAEPALQQVQIILRGLNPPLNNAPRRSYGPSARSESQRFLRCDRQMDSLYWDVPARLSLPALIPA
jgi:hypothetical protein